MSPFPAWSRSGNETGIDVQFNSSSCVIHKSDLMMKKILYLTISITSFFLSCNDNNGPDDPLPETGKVKLYFQHLFSGEPVTFDTLRYTNAAGNLMMFTEIQYFISDVTLHYGDGTKYMIQAWKDIHYIDSDIPATMTWDVYDAIPTGKVDSVTFTFGINETKNQSFIFVNPPESLMFWPDILGGGYHYLKLNGKWIDHLQRISPFNFHLGIGQVYDNQGNITGFVQNFFTVCLDDTGFVVKKGETVNAVIIMDVESWFDTPEVWDLNFWGGDIMQNQAAMQAACLNGKDAFRISLMIED